MPFFAKALCLLLVGLGGACLKLLPGDAADHKQDSALTAGRVQLAWQQAFTQYYGESAAEDSEAWAILSYSGWMDIGQHFFIAQHGQVRYLAVPENFANASHQNPQLKAHLPQKNSAERWQLAPKAWEYFARPQPTPWSRWLAALQDFHKLSPLPRQVFDGLELEYLNLKKEDGKVRVIKRVYINTPDQEHGAEHLRTISNFQTLTTKARP